MSALSTLKNHFRLIREHPPLVRWYLHNRVRQVTLNSERRNADGISRFPRGITIKPTLACNLRCKMCGFVSSGDVLASPKDSLPLDAWISLIDDIAPHGSYVTLTGGEPMLYPHIGELITHIKKRGLICTMTTNGTALSKRAADFMDDPLDALVVSLDGPSRIHDVVRGRSGSFDLAAEGVRTVAKLKKERKQRRPFIIINCSITAFNYPYIEDMLEIAHGLGVGALNYQLQWSLTKRMVDRHNSRHGAAHYVHWEDAGPIEPPPVDPAEIMEAVRRTRRRAASANGRMYITFHPDLDDSEVYRWYEDPHSWVRRRPAVCAWLNTDILPNGDVEPCPGLICGNITQEKFTTIWNNEILRAHRRRLGQAGDLPICIRCCAFFRRD